jgi:hypothetical protein
MSKARLGSGLSASRGATGFEPATFRPRGWDFPLRARRLATEWRNFRRPCSSSTYAVKSWLRLRREDAPASPPAKAARARAKSLGSAPHRIGSSDPDEDGSSSRGERCSHDYRNSEPGRSFGKEVTVTEHTPHIDFEDLPAPSEASSSRSSSPCEALLGPVPSTPRCSAARLCWRRTRAWSSSPTRG